MGLLKPAQNHTAYLKLGLQGFEGSGKTFLANEFAMGLTKLTKGKKVAFFDTEKGSDFWVKKYKAAGIHLDVARSRAFVDLLQVIRDAEKGGYSFLIIDSITHVWRDLQASYLAKNNRTEMSMRAWVQLKTEWSQFTDLYVSSKLHIAMCGRAGYEYDQEEGENGKKEIVKTGTKMRAEGETGFEPDLLIETFKVPISETLQDRKAKKRAKGFVNRCVVIKDRSDTMNAKVLDTPKFDNFLPVVRFLNLGGEHESADLSRNSTELFDSPDFSRYEQEQRRNIMLEELTSVLIKGDMDGTSTAAKKKRVETLERVFGSASRTHLEKMKLDQLSAGLVQLKTEVLQSMAPIPMASPSGQPEAHF